ncbi:EF-P lysine aminoacylase EpmA [Methyloferula stellata]|uniref:EF-P lysine aminoacylase EpmA n=1 Tax=Methyloferula stellata TaxID=876270 RepID=UPI0003A79263|nr:EF-P lysine aminoacylase EpmA [Methyloferula stellata]
MTAASSGLASSRSASPWWRPDIHADRRSFLLSRVKAMAAVRAFFAAEGFLEVDTAILQVSPGNEAHIAGFATEFCAPDGTKTPFYLQSSPEFACKKLLASGEPRIFSLGHCFRNLERGPLHHPEFTMLEWYRAYEPYETLGRDCGALLSAVARALGVKSLTFRGVSADPFLEPERVSVAAAFERYAGIDLLACLPGDGNGRERLAAAAGKAGVRVTEDDTWSDLFSKVLSQLVEPHLGHGRAVRLDQYPACEAALARLQPDDPRFAQRFELYACGVELANGFGELTDPVEQRRRFELEMAERQALYGTSYPIDEDFLSALAIMPQACGIALGFDRLVMLMTGAAHIEQVIWTPLAPTDGAP